MPQRVHIVDAAKNEKMKHGGQRSAVGKESFFRSGSCRCEDFELELIIIAFSGTTGLVAGSFLQT